MEPPCPGPKQDAQCSWLESFIIVHYAIAKLIKIKHTSSKRVSALHLLTLTLSEIVVSSLFVIVLKLADDISV